MTRKQWLQLVAGFALASAAYGLQAQETTLDVQTLDPTRSVGTMEVEGKTHTPLPEQYIWTLVDAAHVAPSGAVVDGADTKQQPHDFRKHFRVDSLPQAATLYLAGPRSVRVFLNGQLVDHEEANLDEPIGMRTFAIDVTRALRTGENVLAIEAFEGPHHGFTPSTRASMQQRHGKVLVAKLVPRAEGVEAAPLLLSDASWKATIGAPDGWQQAAYADSAWPAADALGGIESSIEFFQANVDAGLYAWPGYTGISPFLAQYALAPASVGHVYGGTGAITGATSLSSKGAADLRVELPGSEATYTRAPQIVLDFGREVVGRLKLTNAGETASDVVVQYGESEQELLEAPYLGRDPVHVPAGGSAYGPKSAFRYAMVRFVGGRLQRYSAIELAGIAYPVEWKGSFESSDPALNKLWAIGAYTAHLCMQDDIWDAPKRDRARWMGDLDVSGRTINDAFGDSFLLEHTLDALLGPEPVHSHVNDIVGYSAFWVTGEAEYYRTHEAKQQLSHVHARMVELLHLMQRELDAQSLFADTSHTWPFVDWSPDFHDNSAEARRATQMEFYAAFREGAYLLREAGDTKEAAYADDEAAKILAAAQAHLLDASGGFGTRLQTDAYAVLSGVAAPAQYTGIWSEALSHVDDQETSTRIVTPYYNYYVISAMAKLGHREEALHFIRDYWGGMLAEGATSFWEGYEPDWYKDNFHESLQADEQSGFFVSLAHGWSSGVTPWLTEQVLGIRSTAAAFHTVIIRPDLVDLRYAKGAVPTPRGLLGVSISRDGKATDIAVDLPAGTVAQVSVPISSGGTVTVDGDSATGTVAEGGARRVVTVDKPGHHMLVGQ